MQYMELIRRSVNNAWKYKFLWLFGFFVSAAEGAGGFQINLSEGDLDRWGIDLTRLGDFHLEPAILAFMALTAFSLWIFFWVASVLSEGSLIHGILRKELNQGTTFGDCWSAGLDRFFRLFGIILLATLAITAAIISLLTVIIPSYFAFVGLGIALTVIAIPLLIVIILIVVCVEGWAIRFAVLYDQPWLDAIGSGWQLFITNIGKTLAVAFSSFLTQFVLWCGMVVAMLFLAIPFVIVGMVNLWTGLVPGIGLALLILILSSAFFGTFASSVWTLGFMELAGYTAPQPAAAQP